MNATHTIPDAANSSTFLCVQTWGQYRLETGGNGLSVGRFNPVGLFIGGRVVIAGGMSGNTWSRRVDFFDARRDVSFSVWG
jgi:hypothetical protein